jgi:hypothetical protein
MLDFISENKTWFFDGIGVALLTVIATFFINIFRRKTRQEQPSSSNQTSGDNVVSIQGTGGVSVGSVVVQGNQVPQALAKPDFSIKQVGYGRVGSEDPEYRFKLFNGGGNCFSVKVRFNEFMTEFPFPKIPRGHTVNISTSLPIGTDSLDVTVTGLDANGNKHTQVILGTRHIDGFKFS